VGTVDASAPPTPSGEEPPAPPFDVPVCPRCLGANSPIDNLCRHCGAPAFGIATWGGYEIQVARAWALGEAAIRPDPPFVIVVGGVLLASASLVAPGAVALLPHDPSFRADWLSWTFLRGVGAAMLGTGLYVVALTVLHGLVRETDGGAEGAA
jgi:hypothetical protein